MIRILLPLLLALPLTASAWDELLVITTDFSSTGGASVVDHAAPWTAQVDAATVHSDAVARWHDGLYWVVNRGASNLQVLDPAQGWSTVFQTSVGAGRNPQDIVFAADGSGWVPCYDQPLLLEVDPADGSVVQTYSTAAFADADGLPETGWAVRQGDVLAVLCQRLDRNAWWGPADFSQVLLFDLAARAWIDADGSLPGVQGVTLAAVNPSSMPEPVGDGRRVRVGSAGLYGALDGGIETVDLLTRTTGGLQVTEAQLGGDLIDFVTVGPEIGYALVSDASFRTSLVRYDPRDGSGAQTLLTSPGYDLVDVAWDGGAQLFVADRGVTASGVRVFDALTGAELTAAPVPTGRPPFLIVMPWDDAVTAAPAAAPVAALRLDAPFPNPANPRATVAFTAAPGARVRLEVLDARGRRLRTAAATADAAGRGAWSFDGRADDGRRLPSGLYRVRAVGAAAVAEARFTLAR